MAETENEEVVEAPKVRFLHLLARHRPAVDLLDANLNVLKRLDLHLSNDNKLARAL